MWPIDWSSFGVWLRAEKILEALIGCTPYGLVDALTSKARFIDIEGTGK
jgi:hypothetical protein